MQIGADNEIDGSKIGYKTTKIYKQYAVCNCYHKVFEIKDVLQNGYCSSPLGYENNDWLVNEVII